MIKLYRGFREKLEPGRMKNIFRDKARTPLHSNPNAHHHADEWFKKNFEVAARSTTIICSTDVAQARRYAENGSTLQILPRNPYRLIFSEYVKDFISYIDAGEVNQANIQDWLSKQDYVMIDQTSRLPKYFLGEVMVDCEYFDAVPV